MQSRKALLLSVYNSEYTCMTCPLCFYVIKCLLCYSCRHSIRTSALRNKMSCAVGVVIVLEPVHYVIKCLVLFVSS